MLLLKSKKYTKQLSNLQEAKSSMNNATTSSDEINGSIVKSGTTFKEALILNQVENSIGDELINGYKQTVSSIDEAVGEVNYAIQIVSRKLENYKSLDRAWHNRHHHHDYYKNVIL